jgi:hypothetical protein
MILSNVEIQRAIDVGRLVLDPEPLPRRPAPDGADCPYQTSAVDLQLGDEISYLRDGFKRRAPIRYQPRSRRICESLWSEIPSARNLPLSSPSF